MDNVFNNKQPCFVRWHWVNSDASSVTQEANNRLKSLVFLRWILLLMTLFCCLQPAVATPTTPTSDFIDNKDGTVTHKTTGLTWMRCSMGQTWAGSACSGTASTYTYDTAIVLKSNFAGHGDWRLPNIAELQTIVERENINPAINTAMFPNINIPTNGNSVFWSSSPLVETTKETWTAYFYDGTIINNFRWDSFSVRLVRASQSLGIGVSTPNSDFTDNKDGTVTHKRTGLVWQRCSVGQTWTGLTCSGTASTYTYDQAIALNSTFAGHNDWHAPNANELASIVKYNAVNPTINTTQFPNTPSNDFWSSSPYVGDTSHAWSVAFSYGDVYGSSRDSSLAVRLVHASRLADSTPALAWKKSSTLTITHTPSLGTDGRFYASAFTTSGLHGVAAFNATDGSVAWGPIIPSGCTAFGSEVSVGVNGLLYGVGDWNQCGNGRLVAFNASNGTIAWTHHDCGPHPRQTPALNDALNSVYFGSSALCSVDMNSGIDNWNIDGGYYIGAKGIAIDSSNNIYYGTHSGAGGNTLIQSITSGGVFRWERGFLSPAQDGPIITGMFSEDTTLLQYAATGDLLVWDNNGNDLWQAGNLERPVTDKARNIYASSRLGADVVSLNSTGSERWRRTLPGATWAKMDFVDNTGHVYARGNNVLYQLNSADGSIAWSFAADADLAVGAALTRGGRIFLSDMDANLYLLDTQLNYSISAWPVAEYGDGRHTEKANSANFLSFPVLSITPPTSKDFGIVTVGSTKDMEFRINNTGKGKLKGTASTSAPFSIVSGGSFSLAAGASQAVVVRFSPTTAGSFSDNLSVTSNGGNASLPVTGTGATAPAISVTPTSLSFGSVAVGNSADRSFTIQNTGSGTLAGTCNTAAPFSLPNGCSFSLSAGQSQTINVHFSPTATGSFTGNVGLTSNGGHASLLLQGKGIPASSGILQFNASGYSIIENNENVVVSVTRTGGSKGSASVQYTTANDTAKAGKDYTAKTGTLSWADGETTTKTIVIPIIDDTVAENNETFNVTLSNPTGAMLGDISQATVAIVNDDNVLGARPFPIIFIHGITGTAENTWGSFGHYLIKSGHWTFGGIPTYNRDTNAVSISCPTSPNFYPCNGGAGDFYALNFSDNQWVTLDRQGGELSAIIKAVLDANPGKTKVILVGHSMGGLAAREYVQGIAIEWGSPKMIQYRDDVDKLITVGTPHQGSYWADFCSLYHEQIIIDYLGQTPIICKVDPVSFGNLDLIPGSTALQQLNDLNAHPLQPNISYLSLIGTGTASLTSIAPVSWQDGDGLVTAVSQNLRNIKGAINFKVRSSKIPIMARNGCGTYKEVPVTHNIIPIETHTCETSDPGVWAAILKESR